MPQLSSVITYLDSTLQRSKYLDASLNGVQVGGWDLPITKMAYAVDSGLSVIEAAVNSGANLLLVHHGMFWDKPLAITGATRLKVELLIKHRCTLYASHLPLDGNQDVGNAAELGRFLNLSNISGYLEYKGAEIGARGLVREKSLQYFVDKLCTLTGAKAPLVLPFGKSKISSVGIVTGSGAFAISNAADCGLDLLITGEPKQEAYHLAKELQINVIFAGHYATETFGVAAVSRKIKEMFEIETVFIDEPTGI